MDEVLKARIAQVRQAYAARLEDEVVAMQTAWRRQPPALEALRDQAHQIAGTAPMMGLEAVGREALGLEVAAVRLIEASGRDPVAVVGVEAAMLGLKRAVPPSSTTPD